MCNQIHFVVILISSKICDRCVSSHCFSNIVWFTPKNWVHNKIGPVLFLILRHDAPIRKCITCSKYSQGNFSSQMSYTPGPSSSHLNVVPLFPPPLYPLCHPLLCHHNITPTPGPSSFHHNIEFVFILIYHI